MFKISVKLIDSTNGLNRIIRRSLGHKRIQRLKALEDHTYKPWRSAEVVDCIEETLKIPYQQLIPTSQANHTYQDVGKIYTIPEEDRQHYFQLTGIPIAFDKLTRIFNETTLMVRKPALEIMDFLKNANYDKLPVKYVLYGSKGMGKRMTRLHILHYALLNSFVVLHFPSVTDYIIHKNRDGQISDSRPPFIDMPLEGALILKNFQLQNGERIEDLKLKTTKEYVWNSRESTPAGAPLMTLVTHGINRVKYSCDCVDALVTELKHAATENEIKVLISLDNFNSYVYGQTKILMDKKYDVNTQRLSLYQSVLRTLEPNWCNGAILSTVGQIYPEKEYGITPAFPFFLLKREGFELLDPFIPVEVPKLSEMEFHNMLDYYEDRRYLQKFGNREELEYLSARVPRELRKFVASL